MIGSTFTSFFDNLSTRTKNPFLGTFAVVWICRNWEIVFALFNFDESFTLQEKINFLSERVKYETFWSELVVNILWTFFVLVATYLLINVTRYITNIFENRVAPFVYKISGERNFDVILKKHSKEEILDGLDHILNQGLVADNLDSEERKVIKTLLRLDFIAFDDEKEVGSETYKVYQITAKGRLLISNLI